MHPSRLIAGHARSPGVMRWWTCVVLLLLILVLLEARPTWAAEHQRGRSGEVERRRTETAGTASDAAAVKQNRRATDATHQSASHEVVAKKNSRNKTVGSATDGTAKGSKTASEGGADLAKKLGRNRVSAKTAGGKQVDVDLAGKGHFDKASGKVIETPHVHEAEIHTGPDGKANKSNATVRPATTKDIRMARKIAEKQ